METKEWCQVLYTLNMYLKSSDLYKKFSPAGFIIFIFIKKKLFIQSFKKLYK